MRLGDFSPRWIDLAHGVRVLYTPPGEAEWAAAAIVARRHLAEIEARTGKLDNEESSIMLERLMAKGAARLTISAWEGVEDAFTPAGAEVLMSMPGMLAPFSAQIFGDLAAGKQEGNASAPAPSGTSAAGQNTAPDASNPG